ncbi:hypothetical protein ACS8E2_09605 [Psychrobacter glaciei]|uniref:hypothetical protein n=1 Tax=Psychrobacter glaciei TaxID=619771 RepID=UPI003F48085E
MKQIERDVLLLAELIKRKDEIITDRRMLTERLESDNKPTLFANLLLNKGGRDFLRADLELQQAVAHKSEWIIDVVYDTAIDNLNTQIEPLLQKIKQSEE